jgi:myo-inositol 2-dehydrogenase/D-chiro-inositol 1-dehydrogenase
MRRFDRAYLAMRQTIASGDIGAPLLFHSVHRNASVPPHIGQESLINDTMVHDIDIARWLLADEVAEIRVFPARVNRNSGPLNEPLLAVMRMQGGALVDVEVSVNVRYGYDIRGEVSGETGTVTLAEGNPTVIRRHGFIGAPIDDDWKARFLDAYDAEFRAWIPAAAAGTAAGPSAWDGYAAALVTDAGIRALATGEAQPIRMRERPQLYAA